MGKSKPGKEFNPRTYMELAIEEMRKSLNEPRGDGKIAPMVGAILLFPDGEIKRAHRGELRDGDNAEFSLLERKLGDKKLDDCILFTTLEPCYERSQPKIACCRRTAKARIKKVFVGISDPDPTVSGKGINYLVDRKVDVKMFDRDLQKIIEDVNSEFLSQAKQRRKQAEAEEKKTALEKAVPNSYLENLSEKALLKFIKEANLNYSLGSEEFHQYLKDKGVLEFNKTENKFIPTGSGYLLFGKNPRNKFISAVLKAHVDYGNNKIEPNNFDQALVLIPGLIEEWLNKVLPLSKDTSEFKRKNIPDFPISVLREAVINAIVHRNYIDHSAKPSIEIDNEKIVVKSPGAPHPSISIEQLNKFNAPSISPNPIISYIFYLMGYAEENGFGMKALKSLNQKYNLPLPEYSYQNPFLILTFPRNLQAVSKVSSHPNLSQLNEEELKGYEYLKSQGELSSNEYAQRFNFSAKTARRHLSKMKDLGLIGDNGEKPTSRKFKYAIK